MSKYHIRYIKIAKSGYNYKKNPDFLPTPKKGITFSMITKCGLYKFRKSMWESTYEFESGSRNDAQPP
jgi:hypothetical protein